MAHPNRPSLRTHNDNLTRPQPYSFTPRSLLFEAPIPQTGGFYSPYLPASSINPNVSLRDEASPSPTRSSTSGFSTAGLGVDHLPQRPGPEDELGIYSSFGFSTTRQVPDYLANSSFPSSVSSSPTSPAFEFSHQQYGQLPLPLWTDHSCTSQHCLENTNAVLQYHRTQLLANHFNPIKDHHNSGGIRSKGTKKPPAAKKKELLRKRRNARTDNSGNNQRPNQSDTLAKASKLDIHTHPDTEMGPRQDGQGYEGVASTVEHPDTPEDIPTDEERSDDKDGDATGKTRLKHNRVERRYRQRLNGHYERLLGILPQSGEDGLAGVNSMGGDSEQGEGQVVPDGGLKEPEVVALPNRKRERAVSKAEVLERARSYIKSLEDEHHRLVAERDELQGLWEASRTNCEEVGPV